MPKIITMEELQQMDNDEIARLLPRNFVKNPEKYCQTYGNMEYIKLYSLFACVSTALVPLSNGGKLKYQGFSFIYQPEKNSQN